jgi:hypothetical protein
VRSVTTLTHQADHAPSIITTRDDNAHYWQVGEYFLTAFPTPRSWEVRVRSRSWQGTDLVLDGHFASEDAAVLWCTRMAIVFAQDQADD